MPVRHSEVPKSSRSDHTNLDILRKPTDALAVALAHDDTAHEHLDGPDAFERDLALARRLVEAELMPEFVFGYGVGV